MCDSIFFSLAIRIESLKREGSGGGGGGGGAHGGGGGTRISNIIYKYYNYMPLE